MVGAASLLPARAAAQSGGSLERFEPAPAGDAMFGVPSPWVGGHLVPRATAIFDYAYRPLSVQDGTHRRVIVSSQAFLHLDASLALFDRLSINVDMPFAVAQGGDSPRIAGATFPSPSSAQVGDLRLGARARLYGDYWDPFQLGVGSYFFVPTAPRGSYAGDGSFRAEPQLLLGGRFTHFVWSLAAGTTLRTSAHPHDFEAGAGAAVVLGEDFVQLGPELTLAAPFSKDDSLSTRTVTVTTASALAAELLFGAKVRPIRPLVIGAAAGPGLTNGFGTPRFFAVGSIGYDPLPPRSLDTDGDGIPDSEDACPQVRGVRSEDPKKNGCPPDRDGDGIADNEDACPDVPGVRSDDPKKNGCPGDRDGDGIPDNEDACPDAAGPRNDDPKKNGCPPDTDGDGIPDTVDACPNEPGVASSDPKKNGCPADSDGDGIPDAVDACPNQPGVASPDPKKNGCPVVKVTPTEIEISNQVQFHYGRSDIDQTVDPVSDDLLAAVRDAINAHPEIQIIEVQGHCDDRGDERYNLILSRRRAEVVRDWLVSRGIPAERLITHGYGSSKPRASNTYAPGRQANRRVEFAIRPKGWQP